MSEDNKSDQPPTEPQESDKKEDETETNNEKPNDEPSDQIKVSRSAGVNDFSCNKYPHYMLNFSTINI